MSVTPLSPANGKNSVSLSTSLVPRHAKHLPSQRCSSAKIPASILDSEHPCAWEPEGAGRNQNQVGTRRGAEREIKGGGGGKGGRLPGAFPQSAWSADPEGQAGAVRRGTAKRRPRATGRAGTDAPCWGGTSLGGHALLLTACGAPPLGNALPPLSPLHPPRLQAWWPPKGSTAVISSP